MIVLSVTEVIKMGITIKERCQARCINDTECLNYAKNEYYCWKHLKTKEDKQNVHN